MGKSDSSISRRISTAFGCRSRIFMQPLEDRHGEGRGRPGVQQRCMVPLLVRDDRPACRDPRSAWLGRPTERAPVVAESPFLPRRYGPTSAGNGSAAPWIQGSTIIQKYAIESTGSYFRDPQASAGAKSRCIVALGVSSPRARTNRYTDE